MKLETYLEQTKGWRGQLETGFIFDPTTINAEKVPEYIGKGAPKPKTTVFEDLSYMNPKYSAKHQQNMKVGFAKVVAERKRRWLAALKANGKQIKKPKTHRHGQAL